MLGIGIKLQNKHEYKAVTRAQSKQISLYIVTVFAKITYI